LELLAEGRIEIRQGVDPDLLHRAQTLQQLIAAKANRRVRLLTSQHTGQQIAAIEKEIQEARTEYWTLEGRIRASSPGYAALTQVQPLSASQVRQLLDSDTLLLEYALGEKHSYVWVITRTSIASYELPKLAGIETSARRLYKLLSLPNATEAATRERQRRVRRAAAALSRLVLEPVATELGNKRLLIVADGALQYIPFSVLPDPRKSSQPLLVDHEVVYVPSASVLDILRRAAPTEAHSGGMVAVLADPVFTPLDPRVQSGRSLHQQNIAMQTRLLPGRRLVGSVRDFGWHDLPRLPFSRDEANAISAVTSPKQRLMALGFEASRALATSPKPGKYHVVHFATHALLDEKNPQDSGLVLSMVNRAGQPQDGFLGLEDIYNLDLPVDLVVLSACKTALGKEIKGEGLIGLTRGFMHAGARRVLASLWKVDDAATAQLMKRFYKAMLLEGLDPAAALRRAQLQMSRQTTWSDPYNWGAFILQGEWRRSPAFTGQP
jgi:CHAT domain-containing protein